MTWRWPWRRRRAEHRAEARAGMAAADAAVDAAKSMDPVVAALVQRWREAGVANHFGENIATALRERRS